jgi:hypothetical protein
MSSFESSFFFFLNIEFCEVPFFTFHLFSQGSSNDVDEEKRISTWLSVRHAVPTAT